jgi:hypothetical protein
VVAKLPIVPAEQLVSPQVGQYRFSVTPPTTLPGVTVLGSPLTVNVNPGLADASRSWVGISSPPNPVVGSAVTAQISLVDVYGNPITAPPAGQYNNSQLKVYGMQHAANS